MIWGASGGYIVGFVVAAGVIGFAIFIVGGIVKAVIGAIALPSAWRVVRRFEHG